jgi:antitoxin component YwqK of YwqJK toxin-antitoxin module
MTKRKSIIYFITVSLVLVLVLMLIDFNSIKKLYIITFHKSGMIGRFNPNSKLDGEVDTYVDGMIFQKGNFKNGLLDGWKFNYYKDGKIKSKESFKDGKRHGPKIMYFQSGQIEQTSFRKNNKVEGMEYEYYEDGNLKCQRNWVNNKPYGDFYYYYPNKEVEIYHTYDILGDKFYLCKYDQSGKVSGSEGYVFSSRTYTIDNDSVEVLRDRNAYKSIKDLYVTVANPPQNTSELKVIINNKLCQDLISLDQNTVLIKNAFNQKGLYNIAIEGVFVGKFGFTDHTTGILRIIKE